MPILLDFESRSRADLKRLGGRLYWADSSTEALCCVLYDTDTGDVELWERGQPTPALVRSGKQLGAHNAVGFDRFGAIRFGWCTADHDWIDTSELARRAGLPGGLDALATRWLGQTKDKDASRFTIGLSSARRPSAKTASRAPGGAVIDASEWSALSASEKRARGVLPVCGPAEMSRVAAYCISDVEILAHGWDDLAPWATLEPEVKRVDRAVNDRGVLFDVPLARRLLEEDARNSGLEMERVAAVLGETPARVRQMASSPAQFCARTGLPDATKSTVDAALADTCGAPDVRALCQARQALASIARGKLEAGLARVSPDGRMRDSHRYIGGHTWRWSGRGMQLQNMPRPSKRFESWGDAEICTLADAVLAGGHCDAEEIDLLLRACLKAKPGHTLIVEDFSGVEARALAWAATDTAALQVFASGRDAYKTIAAVIFGTTYEQVDKSQRQVGKVAELACGYGQGADKFYAGNTVALDRAGVNAQAVIDAWRGLHAPVVRFWRDCERALADAAQGQDGKVSCFEFVSSSDGKDVAVMMPNGRPLVYNGVKIGRGERGGREISYQGHHSREKLYGGKIVENLIQSMCRELLAEALVAAEDCGLAPVLHVHDEIVCEVPIEAEAKGADALHAIMTTVPAWCRGFPLGAAGHTGQRYRK